MITFEQYRSGDVPIRPFRDFVLAWQLDDGFAGLRTFYALFNDGRMARSMQVDLWGKRPNAFDFPSQRWLQISAIPDNAIFIGYRFPPNNVNRGL